MSLLNSKRGDKQWPFILVIIAIAILTGAAGGCQLEMSGAVGGKVFYPDSLGTAKVGDPREGEYSPGHAELNSAGEQTGPGFFAPVPPNGEDTGGKEPKGGAQ